MRFTSALSADDVSVAYALLSQGAVWSEHDDFWRVAPTQQHAGGRLRELIAVNARIELEVDAVLADGTMVIVTERLWSDDVPEDLAPLRSTTLYLVEQGLVRGITRVLSTEQRDALIARAMVGPWRCGAFTRFEADRTYARFLSLEYLRSGCSYDSGTYAVEAGVVTTVSGDDSDVCGAGQLFRHRWDVIDADTFAATPIESDCPYFARAATLQRARCASSSLGVTRYRSSGSVSNSADWQATATASRLGNHERDVSAPSVHRLWSSSLTPAGGAKRLTRFVRPADAKVPVTPGLFEILAIVSDASGDTWPCCVPRTRGAVAS